MGEDADEEAGGVDEGFGGERVVPFGVCEAVGGGGGDGVGGGGFEAEEFGVEDAGVEGW